MNGSAFKPETECQWPPVRRQWSTTEVTSQSKLHHTHFVCKQGINTVRYLYNLIKQRGGPPLAEI